MADQATKTCKMCCMEIPAGAKKCPHCHHLQTRSAMFFHSPAFGIVFFLIIAGFLMASFSEMFSNGEDFQRYSDQIEITDSKITFGSNQCGGTVGVIGTIRNHSKIAWKSIRFQVDFQDATGERVDTGQSQPYSYYLPPGESLAFKVSFARSLPEDHYVRHTIRVVTASDARKQFAE